MNAVFHLEGVISGVRQFIYCEYSRPGRKWKAKGSVAAVSICIVYTAEGSAALAYYWREGPHYYASVIEWHVKMSSPFHYKPSHFQQWPLHPHL